MPTFKHDSGKKFFFVHIPRCGGRFLEQNLLHNNNFVWWDGLPVDYMYGVYKGIEVAHFHREYYEEYLRVNNLPHIAIVRNPLDRFISASIYLKKCYGECQELMEDENYFYSMLGNFPCDESVNWFRPQVDFLTSETNIWKFEDGFGDDFAEWLSDVLGVEFVVNEINPDNVKNINRQKLNLEYLEPDHKSRKLDRSAKLVNNITALYEKDIEQLYPELATPFEEGT